MRYRIACLTVIALGFGGYFHAETKDTTDLLIADFEGDTYGDWVVTGDAFGKGPARGTLPG